MVKVFYLLLFFGLGQLQAKVSEVVPQEYLVKVKENAHYKSKLQLERLLQKTLHPQTKILHQFFLFKNWLVVRLPQRPLFFDQSKLMVVEEVKWVYTDEWQPERNKRNRSNKRDKNNITIMNNDIDLPDPAFIEASGIPPQDETIHPDQWGLESQQNIDLDVLPAWKYSKGESTIVAVIDSGVDYNHRDLNFNIWTNAGEIGGNGLDDDGNGLIDDRLGWDFVQEDPLPFDHTSHGTHCAGIIAANGTIKGVAPAARIMPLRFIGKDGRGKTSDALRAIDYALSKGAKILSNSWGGEGLSLALQEAIIWARKRGALFIKSAGNSARNLDEQNSSWKDPRMTNLVLVAAINAEGALSNFSNYGATTVHVAAPGKKIYSTIPYQHYGFKSGTSMAAPFVAGLAALLWPGKKELEEEQYEQQSLHFYKKVKETILHNLRVQEELKGKVLGQGVVNAGASVENYENKNSQL